MVDGHTFVSGVDNEFDGRKVVAECNVDLVIFDIFAPGIRGIQFIKEVKSINSGVMILVCVSDICEALEIRYAQGGADGWIRKTAPSQEIRSSVNKVLAGGKLFSSSVLGKIFRLEISTSPLPSRRELSVLNLLAGGYSNVDIAKKLSINFKTVSNHKINLMKKLGASSTVELLEFAQAKGIIPPSKDGQSLLLQRLMKDFSESESLIIYALARDGRVLFANACFCRMVGLGAKQLYGMTIGQVGLVCDDEVPLLLQSIDMVNRVGQVSPFVEFTMSSGFKMVHWAIPLGAKGLLQYTLCFAQEVAHFSTAPYIL